MLNIGMNSTKRTVLADILEKLDYIANEIKLNSPDMTDVVKWCRKKIDFLLNELGEPKTVKYLERLWGKVNSILRRLKEATGTEGDTDNLINEIRELEENIKKRLHIVGGRIPKDIRTEKINETDLGTDFGIKLAKLAKLANAISMISKTELIMKYCIPTVTLIYAGFRLLKEKTLQDLWTQITTNSDILFEHIVLPLIDIKYIFKTSDKNADIYRKYIEINQYLHSQLTFKAQLHPNIFTQSSQYKHGSTRGNSAETVIKNMLFTPFALDTTSYTDMCLEYNAFKIGTASNKLEFYRSCSQLLKNATLSKEDMPAFLKLCFVANAITTTNYTLNKSVAPYGTSPSRIGTLNLFRTNSTQNSLVPFERPRSIQNNIISLQANQISTTLPCYLLLAIEKDESSGVPRLFTRYWIVTPDMFEDPLRASQLSTFTLSYIVFHPNDVRLPIYIPVYQGSYLNRKDTDYRQAYSQTVYTDSQYISIGESQGDSIEYHAIDAASTETNSDD